MQQNFICVLETIRNDYNLLKNELSELFRPVKADSKSIIDFASLEKRKFEWVDGFVTRKFIPVMANFVRTMRGGKDMDDAEKKKWLYSKLDLKLKQAVTAQCLSMSSDESSMNTFIKKIQEIEDVLDDVERDDRMSWSNFKKF